MEREREGGGRDVEKRGRCSVGRGTDGRCWRLYDWYELAD